MREMTAWEEAFHGQHPRLINVYVATLQRAIARGILPRAMVYLLVDAGWTLVVKHEAAPTGFFAVKLLIPERDGVAGRMAQPPSYFKAALREYISDRRGATLQ